VLSISYQYLSNSWRQLSIALTEIFDIAKSNTTNQILIALTRNFEVNVIFSKKKLRLDSIIISLNLVCEPDELCLYKNLLVRHSYFDSADVIIIEILSISQATNQHLNMNYVDIIVILFKSNINRCHPSHSQHSKTSHSSYTWYTFTFL
jgi:hypothetical protein